MNIFKKLFKRIDNCVPPEEILKDLEKENSEKSIEDNIFETKIKLQKLLSEKVKQDGIFFNITIKGCFKKHGVK